MFVLFPSKEHAYRCNKKRRNSHSQPYSEFHDRIAANLWGWRSRGVVSQLISCGSRSRVARRSRTRWISRWALKISWRSKLRAFTKVATSFAACITRLLVPFPGIECFKKQGCTSAPLGGKVVANVTPTQGVGLLFIFDWAHWSTQSRRFAAYLGAEYVSFCSLGQSLPQRNWNTVSSIVV